MAAPNKHFQPMNANYGVLKPLLVPPRKKADKKRELSGRSLERIKEIVKKL